jgi:hypothetical protein
MPQKWFPIQDDLSARKKLRVPWAIAEKAYAVYSKKYGTSQSLTRLAERGGFGILELIWLLSGGEEDHTTFHDWTSHPSGKFAEEVK